MDAEKKLEEVGGPYGTSGARVIYKGAGLGTLQEQLAGIRKSCKDTAISVNAPKMLTLEEALALVGDKVYGSAEIELEDIDQAAE